MSVLQALGNTADTNSPQQDAEHVECGQQMMYNEHPHVVNKGGLLCLQCSNPGLADQLLQGASTLEGPWTPPTE
jgi:hypothetical protein